MNGTAVARVVRPPAARDGKVPDHASVDLFLRPAWTLPGLLLLVAAPAILGSLLVDDESYQMLWKQPVFFDTSARVLAVGTWLAMFVVALAVSVGLPSRVRVTVGRRTVERLGTAMRTMALITFVSYAVWFLIGALRGLPLALVADVIAGSNGAMYQVKRVYLAPIGGVTTWMQLGSLLGPLAVLHHRLTGRSHVRLVAVLLGLALVRSVLVSERLALLEVVVSTTLAFVMTDARMGRLAARPQAVVLGFGGAWVGLYAVFGALEYVRSWTNHYQAVYPGSFFRFAFERVLGYYATALNNAAMVGTPGSGASPWLLVGGDFGGDIGLGLGAGPQLARESYGAMLEGVSNPEFNNQSGLLLAPVTLGALGGIVVWVALVLLVGHALRRAARGSLVALLVYCVSAVGILEVVRLFYFGQSRFVIIVLGVLLARVIIGRGASTVEAGPAREAATSTAGRTHTTVPRRPTRAGRGGRV